MNNSNFVVQKLLSGTASFSHNDFTKLELINLIENREEFSDVIQKRALTLRKNFYANKVYIRGLIEISNYCKCNCYYCGIRCANKFVKRYRLTDEEIFNTCAVGYKAGFRTFVLQGGEDLAFDCSRIHNIIKKIKTSFSDCAITLSLGEHSIDVFENWKLAGADRYLLRHETVSSKHFQLLHPNTQKYDNRIECLWNLKKLSYQVGSGFLVGSPYQTTENLADDLLFLLQLNPQMIGIGPFIPHSQTPFAKYKSGSVELTLFLISVLRILFPRSLIPATTALNTLCSDGHALGILHGANVIMPNLTPQIYRKNYSLYDGKKITDEECAENLELLKKSMKKIDCEIVINRGDSLN